MAAVVRPQVRSWLSRGTAGAIGPRSAGAAAQCVSSRLEALSQRRWSTTFRSLKLNVTLQMVWAVSPTQMILVLQEVEQQHDRRGVKSWTSSQIKLENLSPP